ncbi:MAG TPA: glycosyltransferase family 2 protein [Chloroflexota bacterium]|nr:glycosyltransferase family 2 protein [Chloroflexota bacterium]HUM67665.1 glycosyltransferase family 2 protein [Chloroflexota bacterium]
MENLATSTNPGIMQNLETAPDMSIVLVCWNNKAYLEPCLNSIYDGGLRSSYDIVVVDNGSTDGSQEMLREKFPEVIIIQNDHNVGLGKASNQGIEATNGRHILLLNNDTVVNAPSLDAMVDYLDQHPDVGAVGGQLLNADGTVQSCYNDFPSLIEEFFIATQIGEKLWPGYPANVTDKETKSVDWMGSACLMVRRQALDTVGLLDEEYFIYGDEADLQYRLKKAGWKNYYLPQATTIHYGGRSMNRWSRRKMVYRGHMLFFQKNYGPLRTWALRILLGSLSLVKLLVWSVAFLLPAKREQAEKELKSNIDVVKLCWSLA